MKARWLALPLVLAACGSEQKQATVADGDRAGAALDRQAIEKGIIPDPESLAFEGRFETQSDLGTDKFCAVSVGDTSYRIGFLSVYGSDSKCEGQGNAEQDGDSVRVVLEGKQRCSFTASFDGIVLRFPGTVPEGCASYCSRNASMSGTRYYFVDRGSDAAKRVLGREIERLCR
ncbi:MAG: hypothetical protein IPG54_00570 [Sphingomonadales bacterium]|nr:hypothetical protein [Sphingomonadales bacterium]MBK9003798.1 hypothetical protein [Sphingomonadales bacterium]MBK9268972.1 hypothetical protein [Sphingomonadales bacterium]MBP6435417.1 hypothetical protein [Sphingorhabdus sp.]